MNDTKIRQHPMPALRKFLDKYVVDQAGMVFTLKVDTGRACASCNLRGPFHLSDPPYQFPSKEETVLEADFSTFPEGEQESTAHIHVQWKEIASVKLTEANPAVKENMDHDYQLTFFDHASKSVFWFYIRDARHPAVQQLELGATVNF